MENKKLTSLLLARIDEIYNTSLDDFNLDDYDPELVTYVELPNFYCLKVGKSWVVFNSSKIPLKIVSTKNKALDYAFLLESKIKES